ncbi:uncharacterized protein TNCV_3945871 [Trichonephila clavipes]|nr:uncharacterized protein TNCV_3945871 [Trichonephila clavipes]
MAGCHIGVQQRIKDINPNAEFVPCSNHSQSLNLRTCTFSGTPRRIRRKHILGNGSKDVQLSYEDDLRRTMFSTIDRVTAEIREKFQQLQNLAQKYTFLIPEVTLSMDELNLDQTPQNINKEEFQLERVRLQAFAAAT